MTDLKKSFFSQSNAVSLFHQVKKETKLPLNREFADQILLFMKGIWVSKPVLYYREETKESSSEQLDRINNTVVKYASEYARVCAQRIKIQDEAETLLALIEQVMEDEFSPETNYNDLVNEVNRLKKIKGIRAQAWISLLQCFREDILIPPEGLQEGLERVLSQKVKTLAKEPMPCATIEELINNLKEEARSAWGLPIEEEQRKEKNKIEIPLEEFLGMKIEEGKIVIYRTITGT